LSAQESLTLYVGAGLPDAALPQRYLRLPTITVMSAPAGQMLDTRTCMRCYNGLWQEHGWVLFTDRRRPLDCSRNPRRGPA
jgi:hypothetical protein